MSLFDFWKRNPPRKPRPAEPLKEDWAAGDLAECLSTSAWPLPNGPEPGDVLRVMDVVHTRGTRGDGLSDFGFFLTFRQHRGGYEANGFRKVMPLNSACDEEFAQKIKDLTHAKVDAV